MRLEFLTAEIGLNSTVKLLLIILIGEAVCANLGNTPHAVKCLQMMVIYAFFRVTRRKRLVEPHCP